MRGLLALMLIASFVSKAQAAEILVTPNYRITVSERCEEGVVGCDNVSYVGVNTKTGKSISLNGKSVMVMCADGVTPCHLAYYEFKNGELRYSVFPDGRLTVEKGGKVIVSESGTWQ
jgi:hypothetical protein